MYRDRIIASLRKATDLAVSFARGEISFRDFVKLYDNFYYYEALDGHEASVEQALVQSELRKAIEFHRKVQCEVVDVVRSDPELVEKSANYVSEEEAKTSLLGLVNQYDAARILEDLS